MKLLVLTNNPRRASFRQRIAVHIETLARHGIECELAVFPVSASARKRLFRHAAGYEGVYLHKRRLNILDARLLRRNAKTIIYDFDDAVMYSPRRPQKASWSHARPFYRTAKLADLVIAGNSYLAGHARRSNSNVEILPTGLDTQAYSVRRPDAPSDKLRLVWIGSRSTLKYLAEIAPALEQIGTVCPNVVLRIICDDFLDLENIMVERETWSLETQCQALAACHIGLAPLPDNRFTRGKCGFKILQYAAAGIPTVASPVGVNSEYVQEGVTGMLVDKPRQWVEKIRTLVENEQMRRRMGANARDFSRDFDVAAIGRCLADLINKYAGQFKS